MRTAAVPATARAGFGQALRARRLAQGWCVEEVAARLRLSSQVVEAIENDDRERLGATVFARGRVGSYARLLGVPMEAVDVHFPREPSTPPPRPEDATRPGSRRGTKWIAGKGVFATIMLAVTVPMISMAAMHGRHDVAATVAPSVRGGGDRQVDMVETGGQAIDRGSEAASSVRRDRDSAAARVAIRNPTSVITLRDGEPIDLQPFRSADQVRFALSSARQPTPVRD